ncbi:protein ANTAGONIST OF LIKE HETEROCHROMATIN PROTEIN 1-like [Bufo gargarizans]|uniref:protein ANTAGONIST OF LIKE HETEROCHROMATIN PROTEIN 1-like n=1 Tax=Bufo gargarizans TaxID=30331 RepID=UPI001CF3447E|nr:protein ANTAGONIST OF LIKE HETEROCHROMATIN PROTEIN 1-like [Bufo gargarizans]XP_044157455.1 protein ANTAGONIST OF LIKE HETEROCHROMATIN PROTEIN 1-like [Bufo gargarizans]XP_044157456.1 protein ANTAGONIST OF LIKE HETEROCHROMATIN PROTEIN 1-like [Bufo gargarizans]XP_044157457.1 protein ANTAGONIST OF LIKE HETEROCHROMATIN PROTEIN 1-like [Bufo gargarizans]XP_044157458.1 protein ANTAGONIST OF LIKE HETEROCHROMATIN PROTEIN 1-like [Bufo gargarizans]
MLPAHLRLRLRFLILKARWRRRDQERRRRRYWVHPITSKRMTRGVFSVLYLELRERPETFFTYMHMTVESFDQLLQRISTRIERQDTRFRRAISPAERLMVTIRFLATGESLSSLHYQYRMGISTISSIVQDTCRALWEVLCEDCIPHPTTQQWLQIADKFLETCQFPNCVGAVDGKHIRIVKPSGSGSEFFNYKKYFSMILMAIADADYRFVAVDIGAYGWTNDSMAFKNSAMGRLLYSKNFGLPPPRPFPGTDGPPVPFVVVGDEAFQMCENLIKPYSSRDLNPAKRVFNYRLTRARQTVECAFGILVAKWRILTKAINLKVETIDDIVKACVVLHNYLLMEEPLRLDPQEVDCTLTRLQRLSYQSTLGVADMRDSFADYFVSEAGRVSWQDNVV